MKIHEISLERGIILKFSKEGDSAEITAIPMKVKPGALLLHPIYINDKVFVLKNDEKIRVDVIYSSGEAKPLIWRSVGFKSMVIDGVPHLSIYTNVDGVEHNRRSSFRLPMDVVGMVDNADHVIIRDISSNGLSFRTNRDVKKAVHASVRVKFNAGTDVLELKGTIVRELSIEDGYIYGCKIEGSMELDKFIADEQNRRFFQRRVNQNKK